MRNRVSLLAVAIPVIFLLLLFFAFMPTNYDSLGWRVDALKADIKYALNPPEQRVFVPNPTPENFIPSATPSPVNGTFVLGMGGQPERHSGCYKA
jgi:hypothetical protein